MKNIRTKIPIITLLVLWKMCLFAQESPVSTLLETGRELVCRHGSDLESIDKIKQTLQEISERDFEEITLFRAISPSPFDYDKKLEIFIPSLEMYLSVELLQQGIDSVIEFEHISYTTRSLDQAFIVRVTDNSGPTYRQRRPLGGIICQGRPNFQSIPL